MLKVNFKNYILLLIGYLLANTFLFANSDQTVEIKSDLNSYEFSKNFGRGWNLGNSLEAIGGETAWGNPVVTQELIDAVKSAGFNTIRIPVAWSKFTNETNYTIDSEWLSRVEEVVNYALNNNMYVVLNEHWDEGWLQPTYEHQNEANYRLAAMWEQIANYFEKYDDRLLFAGTNEVMVEGDYSTPTKEYYTVQNGFNQVFVNTVRATGGNNANRYLVVQGFNTNINHTIDFFEMPEDNATEKLLVEVHYYDPYNFTLNEGSDLYVWGEEQEGSEEWANELYADNQFNRLKNKFINNGIGVIVGEYGAIARLELGDDLNKQHAENRKYWLEYITKSIVQHGLVPYYWDNGYTTNHAFGLFDRNTGEPVYTELINVIVDESYLPIHDKNPNEINEELLLLYPNPAQNTISFKVLANKFGSGEIYDSLGQLVRTIEIKKDVNTINIHKLPVGIYYLNIDVFDGKIVKKFIKE